MVSKKFIMVNTIILLLLLVSSDLISQETTQKNDFRNTRWGMKKDKVLSTEKNKPLGAGSINQYRHRNIGCHFGNDKGVKDLNI